MKAMLWLALAACKNSEPSMDATTSHWSEQAMLPVPRLEPGVTAMGLRVIVVGGFDTPLNEGLQITPRVDMFDPAMNLWTQLPDAPVQWTHIQLAAIGTTIYILGGLEGQTYTARGETYALDTQAAEPRWVTLSSMPPGLERGSAAVVVAPPRIYLFGGAGTTNALATNLYFDTINNTWTQLTPDLPAPRSHPAGMRRSDGTFVVTGGLETLDSSSQAGDTWILPPLGTMWMPMAAMPMPRGGCAYGEVQGQLICAGGEGGVSAFQTVESYDPLADTWTQLQDMPDARAGTQGAAIGDQLFVPGGARQLVFEPLSSLFVYTANI